MLSMSVDPKSELSCKWPGDPATASVLGGHLGLPADIRPLEEGFNFKTALSSFLASFFNMNYCSVNGADTL